MQLSAILVMTKCNCYSFCFKSFKASVMTAADDIHKYFFIVFLEKIRLDISCESSRQRIHMKNQALFSSKDKKVNNKNVLCCKFCLTL